MDFTDKEQKFIEKIKTDDNYIKYIARTFFINKGFDFFNRAFSLDAMFFDRLFSVYPDIEDIFENELIKVAERTAVRLNSIALPIGLKRVADIITNEDGKSDSRVILQAAALQLQFYMRKKEKKAHVDDDALDEIYKKLQKENDDTNK